MAALSKSGGPRGFATGAQPKGGGPNGIGAEAALQARASPGHGPNG